MGPGPGWLCFGMGGNQGGGWGGALEPYSLILLWPYSLIALSIQNGLECIGAAAGAADNHSQI